MSAIAAPVCGIRAGSAFGALGQLQSAGSGFESLAAHLRKRYLLSLFRGASDSCHETAHNSPADGAFNHAE